MLKAVGSALKLVLFSIAILVIGNWVSWDGRTLSDHVRRQISRAERSDTAAYLQGVARKVTEDARSGFDKKIKNHGRIPAMAHAQTKAKPAVREDESQADDNDVTDRTEIQSAAPKHELHAAATRSDEKIPSSERQKLRALIRELNSSSHSAD
jgi:hypothetical protein